MHYQLLLQLSCSLLLVAAHFQEEPLTTEFPEDLPLEEMSQPSAQENELMDAHRINWMVIDKLDQTRQAGHLPDTESPSDIDKEEHEVSDEVDEVETTTDLELEEEETLTREGGGCPTNSDRGLNGLIRNARPLLPLDRLRNILANARQDPEVRDLIKLLRSEEFQQRVRRLQSTKEKIGQKNFMCQQLKLDLPYYVEYLRIILNTQLEDSPTSPLPYRRKGIRGLLQDLRDALPRGELRDLYRRQLATDRELATAVRRIRSSEFRRLISSLRALPEYIAVRDELQKAGVPLPQMLNLVTNALGWSNLDLGSEIEFISG